MITLIGFGYDDLKVVPYRIDIANYSDACLLPYPFKSDFHLVSNGIDLRYRPITEAPIKGTKVYCDKCNLTNFLLKDKYEIVKTKEADLLISDFRQGYRTFKVKIFYNKDNNCLLVMPQNCSFPETFPKVYEGTVAAVYGLWDCDFKYLTPIGMPVCSVDDIIHFAEAPEYDFTVDTCASILELITSDKSNYLLGMTTLFSMNFLKYLETTKALLHCIPSRYDWDSEDTEDIQIGIEIIHSHSNYVYDCGDKWAYGIYGPIKTDPDEDTKLIKEFANSSLLKQFPEIYQYQIKEFINHCKATK